MKLTHAWLFLILFAISVEFQYFIRPPVGMTVAQFFFQWIDPRNKGGWQIFRRVAWMAFFIYLVYRSAVELF